MDRDQVTVSLEVFLAERGRPLLRAAVLLTGSQQAGEDLLQAALERLLKHWREMQGDPRRAASAPRRERKPSPARSQRCRGRSGPKPR